MAPGPLSDLVVLDLTRFLSGPYCTLQLAGMGARVIKVDHPVSGDPTIDAPPFSGPDGPSLHPGEGAVGIAYLKRQRGKQSISIDLKQSAGAQLLRDLAAHADVVVENFRPGVAERLGIDYAALNSINPAIVYCAITGYGQSGPDASLKSYDLMAQAASGLMGVTGEPGGRPMKAGSPLADTIAGTWGALAILAAIHECRQSGLGQSIDISMQDCLFSMMMDEPLDCYEALGQSNRIGNRIMRFSPFNAYQCLDGWIVIGSVGQADWAQLTKLLGRPELADHPDYSQVAWRIDNNDTIDAIVGEWVVTQSVEQVIIRLQAVDIACSPVRSPRQAINAPHLVARNMIQPLTMPDGTDARAIGPNIPIRMSRSFVGHQRPAPEPAAHTAQVLSDLLSLDESQIAQLREQRVI